jgi:AmmeMemoRadiSam system protein A
MSFDVLGIIAPHPPIMVEAVGHDEAHVTDASIAAMGVAARLLAEFDPDTVVVMSPHSPGFRDAFTVTTASRVAGTLGQFGASASRLDVPGDSALAASVLAAAERHAVPAVDRTIMGRFSADELDHGVLVPMSFLDPGGRWPLLDLAFSFLPYADHAEFGRAVAEAARQTGRRVAFVASGDMSHRLLPQSNAGYSPRAHLFDEQVVSLLSAGDFVGLACIDPDLIDVAGECGLRSFITLGGFLEGTDHATKVLSYEGPWGVGYMVAVSASPEALAGVEGLTPPAGDKGGMPGEDESAPVALARHVIASWLRDAKVPEVDADDDPLLATRAGAFVSLHRRGELRGCIGTIAATRPTLAEEIAHNAVEAATRDPRFPSMTVQELDDLEISVDVLGDAEPAIGLEDLDPKVYGCIVSCDWRRGLLLPDLEGVDTPQQQVEIACRKAGIRDGEAISLERFKVERYH